METMHRRVLIVDDEEPGRINLRFALGAHPSWQIAAECADTAQARAFLATQAVDVIFLDIRMPRESGLELAHDLAHDPALQAAPPLVIFVTAYDTHAVEAFRVHALDYLLKPLDDAELAKALTRADALITQRQLAAHTGALRDWSASSRAQDTPVYLHQLNVRSVGRLDLVRLEDVQWIEAAGNYVELHLAQRRVLHRVAIGTLERHLDPAVFVRVHRSALVRLDHVEGLRTGADGASTLTLRCGAAVPVSERHLGKVRKLLSAA